MHLSEFENLKVVTYLAHQRVNESQTSRQTGITSMRTRLGVSFVENVKLQ